MTVTRNVSLWWISTTMTRPDLRSPKNRVDITKLDDLYTSAGKCFILYRYDVYIYIYSLEVGFRYSIYLSYWYVQSSQEKTTWNIPLKKMNPFLHLQYQWVGPFSHFDLDPASIHWSDPSIFMAGSGFSLGWFGVDNVLPSKVESKTSKRYRKAQSSNKGKW